MGLGQESTLSEWAGRAEARPVTMLSEQMRLNCMRLYRAGLRRVAGMEPPGMLGDARAANIAREFSCAWDEAFEIARALMLAGDWETLRRQPVNQTVAFQFERVLFAVDREINLLRRKLRLAPWDPDLNWPRESLGPLPKAAKISASEATEPEASLFFNSIQTQALTTTALSRPITTRSPGAESNMRPHC